MLQEAYVWQILCFVEVPQHVFDEEWEQNVSAVHVDGHKVGVREDISWCMKAQQEVGSSCNT